MKQPPAPPPPPPVAAATPVVPAAIQPQLRAPPVSSSPKLRPILPTTTEAARQLVRERIQAQLNQSSVGDSLLQQRVKPRPIIPNLTSPPRMRRPQLLSSSSAPGHLRVPSTVFVQPVSSSVSLAPATPMLRASSSTHLPAVQLLVSTPSLVCA